MSEATPEIPCKQCGSETKFNDMAYLAAFPQFCSKDCRRDYFFDQKPEKDVDLSVGNVVVLQGSYCVGVVVEDLQDGYRLQFEDRRLNSRETRIDGYSVVKKFGCIDLSVNGRVARFLNSLGNDESV